MELKINIGCGPSGQIDGFVNLDNSPSVLLAKSSFLKSMLYKLGMLTKQQFEADWRGVVRCDASKHLPFSSGSVSLIYSSHFLEHIPQSSGECVLRECFRVLKPHGVMRLVVPDLYWYADRYVKRTHEIMNSSASLLPEDRTEHDRFLNTIYGAYLHKQRYGLAHCYMYDFPTLVCILRNVGFVNIQRCEYQKGKQIELAQCDSRPEDSLHIEIRK